MKTDTRDGPTPNGGVKSRICYSDDDGNLVDKEVATRARIVEYNEAGGSRTFCDAGIPLSGGIG
jgi:hypothetical protein